jgi:hypothetical protein
MTKRISDWRDRPWDSPWTGDPIRIAAADAVTEIGLSRSMCYGSCPVYNVSLRRSGEARFEGEHFVDLLGTHIARIEPGDFEVLALAVAHLGFDALAPDYTVAITCQPTATTWLVRGDVRRQVGDYGSAGPRSLHVIEGLIDAAASELRWRPEGGKAAGSGGPARPPSAQAERRHWTQRRYDGNDAAAALDTAGLTARERRLLQLRFGLEDGRARTLEEVGREFMVTEARVRQIEAKALGKVRGLRRSRRERDDTE